MPFRRSIAIAAALALAGASDYASAQTRLLAQPDISDQHVAFVYAGDLWLSNHQGGDVRRLTSTPAEEHAPFFSPDGQWLAFAAEYEGNTSVYMMPVVGGTPKRLTWHPGNDVPVGWSADGQSVAFASRRETDQGRSAQLYHVSVDGGAPERQMEARFFRGQWHEDGEQLAYIDHGPAYNGLYGGSAGWRGYRGGTTPSVHILTPGTDDLVLVPGERVNDIQPFWLGDQVVFISDRDDKRLNLFSYDTGDASLQQLTAQSDWDIHWANGHGDQIVYEAGGELYRMPMGGEAIKLAIDINADLPQRRVSWQEVRGNISGVNLSPNGKRVLLTARGEVFTVPAKHGTTRNLSSSDGVREYPALWSPKGDQIAWIEESLDGQELVLANQQGDILARHELGGDFYQLEAWDGERGQIAYTDNGISLFVVDLEEGESRKVGEASRMSGFDPAFSPDGRWLAYTRHSSSYLSDLVIVDLDSNRSTTVSDGMADVASPVFSRDGAYLYFAASTNAGPIQFGLDMSTQERPYRAGLYALVLAADGESPLAPRLGDEDAVDASADEDGKDESEGEENGTPAVTIDFDGLAERMVSLPVAKGNYSSLAVAADGSLFWMQRPQPGSSIDPPGEGGNDDNHLLRFDFEKREVNEVFAGFDAFRMSASGSHLLLWSGGSVQLAEAGADIKPEAVDLSGLRMSIDPQKEWAQIFDEGWRMQKEYFYASNLHGLDWDAVYQQYRPLVDHVARREDLNAVMVEMIAELHAGHNRVGGGDVYSESGPGVGLLGANFEIAYDRWRISKIYSGESWNAFLRGPLSQPGNQAQEGDYLLAINGQALTASDNLFERLHNTVDKQVRLTLGSRPDARGDTRDIIVEPVGNEGALRLWSWVEANRKAVNEATDGRVGYIYLPNTAGAGYTFFNRMFFAQLDKQALIIDERGNGGGQAADYIVEVLSRPHLSHWVYRHGETSRTPFGSLHGPKLMMIDQDAGSGGDYMPYAFRELGIGPLLGTRTWGGLIGIYANPGFVDGGVMTVPHFRFVDADNNWSVENEGVAPDIEVDLSPVLSNQGRDSQLEAAIETILERLQTYSDDVPEAPPALPTELGQ
jgi:tricorn protease